MRTLIVIALFIFGPAFDVAAQCAMCRATLENNLSNGDIGIAAGINIGIMYLFCAPYIAVGLLAFFWFKTTRSNERKKLEKRAVLR
ncbi:MAG: hypothetical protein RIA63_13060 [Cyclobacteriaceae bacterium]